MAKRRLLQWMRDRLASHAEKVVIPVAERKAFDAAYARAAPLVTALVAKKYPPADMKVLRKYEAGREHSHVKVQFPSGVIVEFAFAHGDYVYMGPLNYNGRIFLADATTATALERWEGAKAAFDAERKKRFAAYTALIQGASTIEDIIDIWPEAKGVLPAGSPPIPLGPEQIALVKADQRERKAA